MYYDIVRIEHKGNYDLEIYFENGEKGIANFEYLIHKGDIFKNLANKTFFAQAYIDSSWKTLCWPGEIDIAPETVFFKITGKHINKESIVEVL